MFSKRASFSWASAIGIARSQKIVFLQKKQFLQSNTTADVRKTKLKRLLNCKKIVKILEAHNPIGGLIIDNLSNNSEKKI